MALTATARKVGDVSVVDLNGKITLGEHTELLRDEVRSLLSQGARNLVFNMAHVGYIDSSGLGELVGAYTTAANQGGSLKLLNLQSKTRELPLQVSRPSRRPDFHSAKAPHADISSA